MSLGLQMNLITSPVVLASLIAGSTALGAALFAFAASLFNAHVSRNNTLLQARISQRTKRAEFRQSWINSLRECLISFNLGVLMSGGKETRELVEAGIRFQMLMNPNDQDYEKMNDAMIVVLGGKSWLDHEDFDGVIYKKLIATSQSILKRECEVMKHELTTVELAN